MIVSTVLFLMHTFAAVKKYAIMFVTEALEPEHRKSYLQAGELR